ncbi:fasciclin domain-containing protein [Pseudonocardia bannensis]|uniref:Fasciclin domain-containing protein n=1 Tax=Pseudonocardia bannensis TaxID=630973 RepID=A0A848DLL3_9PSEU|nr:fasciclin domain-containing protein [Pseudonocardia bannensis]NMH93433.1 fasciclin domain-containing protein [Pseudonocardia bannensis]
MAALTVTSAACGNSESASTAAPQPTAAAAPTSRAMPASDGVTTNADVFGPACSQLPQGAAPGSLDNMGPQPVASAASTNPLLTTLVSAAGKVPGLVDALNGAEALTVYAPANSAFEKIPADTLDAVLADAEQLSGLLSYHVSGTRYDRDGLLEAGKTTQLAGGTVTVGGSGDNITLTGGNGQAANVVCGNIPTSNATVFVIDAVLMPAS